MNVHSRTGMTRKNCNEPGCTKGALGKMGKCVAHGGGERCIEPGCTKGALGKTAKCASHGGGNRCNEAGCMNGAQGKTAKCIAHGVGKRCIESGCTNSVQGNSAKCISHGGGERCNEPGCTKGALGNTANCAAHGGGKLCNEYGCTKSAQGKAGKCKGHGGGKRCNTPGCTKSAEGKSKNCVAHGGGKRCIEDGCTKSALGKTAKCAAHGGGERCPNCITWIDSRSGSKKYDGYCATCFKRLFPSDKRSTIIYEHTKEIRVRNAINEVFDGFVHDTPLYTGNCDCTHRRRIDHRKLIDNTILAIETDEHAHIRYDPKDEEIRYDDLYMIHSGKWIFIRFNPDGKGVDIEDKLDKLIETIHMQLERIGQEKNTELLEIIKLFY